MKLTTPLLCALLFGMTVIFLASCENNSGCVSGSDFSFNGSFEESREGLPVNWAFFPNSKSNPSFQFLIDSEEFVDGKHSLKLLVKKNGKIPGLRSCRVPVKSGVSYKLSLLAKGEGASFKVNRILQDSWGKSNLRTDIIFNTPKASTNWHKYEETLTVAEHESYLLLIILIDSPGTVWFDDIRLEEIK
jgi:hypothetical protein